MNWPREYAVVDSEGRLIDGPPVIHVLPAVFWKDMPCRYGEIKNGDYGYRKVTEVRQDVLSSYDVYARPVPRWLVLWIAVRLEKAIWGFLARLWGWDLVRVKESQLSEGLPVRWRDMRPSPYWYRRFRARWT